MKKRYLFASFFALLAATGLASCSSKNNDDNNKNDKEQDLENISIDFAKTEFVLGEKFDTNALKVTAHYKDGTAKDVTANASITPFATDLNTVGSYTVTVTYEGKSTDYTFTVVAPNNVKTLKALDVKTTAAKTAYNVGETISYDKLALYATYSNSTTTAETIEYVTDLTDYTKEVKDSKGTAITGKFVESGSYTVTISKGEIKTSYIVTVDTVNALTVEAAVNAGVNYAENVNGGTIVTTTTMTKKGSSSEEATYAFGHNYTKISYEYYGEEITEHYSLNKDQEIFAVKETNDGTNTTLGLVDGTPAEEMMRGYKFNNIFGGTGSDEYIYYGVEELLEELYKEAKKNENDDFKEECLEVCTHCGKYNRYSFEFSKLFTNFYQTIVDEELVNVDIISAIYKINVEFTLGSQNQFENVVITSTNYGTFDWERQEYYQGFVENEGKMAIPADATPTATTVYEINQSVGAKDLVNEFTEDKMVISSYDMKKEDTIVTSENNTFDLTYGDQLVLKLDNVAPAGASFGFDKPVVEGEWFVNWKAFSSFNKDENTLTLTFYTVGTQEITIKTLGTTKTIVVNIPQLTPTTISSDVLQVNGEFDKRFVNLTEKTLYLDGADVTIWFKSYVESDNYDGSYTAELVNSPETATLTPTKQTIYDENDLPVEVDVHEFKAMALGTYYVKITSMKDTSVSSVLTITVAEKPNVAEILNGSYAFSFLGGMYTADLDFTPTSDGALSGTLVVSTVDSTRTATVTKTGTFAYQYTEDNGMALVHTDGDTIAGFAVRISEELKLEAYLLNDWRELEKQPDVISIPETLYGTYEFVDPNDTSYTETLVITSEGVTINGTPKTVKACDETSITIDYYGDTILTLNADKNLEDANTGFVYVKKEEEKLEIPSNILGVYTSSSDSLTITETTILYDGYTYAIVSFKDNVLSASDDGYPLTLTFTSISDTEIVLINDLNNETYTKSNGELVEIVIPESLYGTYAYEAEGETNYTIVITADGVVINEEAVEVKSVEDGGLVVIYGEDDLEYSIYEYYSSDKLAFACPSNRFQIFLDRTSNPNNPDEVTIPNEYIGTFAGVKDETNYTVVITADSITINDVAVTNIEVINYFGTSISFTYDSVTYGLVFDTDGATLLWTTEAGDTFASLTKNS